MTDLGLCFFAFSIFITGLMSIGLLYLLSTPFGENSEYPFLTCSSYNIKWFSSKKLLKSFILNFELEPFLPFELSWLWLYYGFSREYY